MSSVNDGAQQQWGTVEFGDARWNARALAIGTGMAAHPDCSLPSQMSDWSDLKAAYRFLHHDSVTHAGLSQPHWQRPRQAAESCAGPVLFIQDGTTLDFTGRAIEHVGRLGDDNGRGLLTHSVIAVSPGEPAQLLGLAHHSVWARVAVDATMLEFLSTLLHQDADCITIYVFWREIAKMGGFLARTRDGEPGWQTLWRGWNRFYPRFEGYLIGKSCG